MSVVFFSFNQIENPIRSCGTIWLEPVHGAWTGESRRLNSLQNVRRIGCLCGQQLDSFLCFLWMFEFSNEGVRENASQEFGLVECDDWCIFSMWAFWKCFQAICWNADQFWAPRVYSLSKLMVLAMSFCFARDASHPKIKEIYDVIDLIGRETREKHGYSPNCSQATMVDSPNNIKQSLKLQSERLAIAFGLLNLKPSMSIRIFNIQQLPPGHQVDLSNLPCRNYHERS